MVAEVRTKETMFGIGDTEFILILIFAFLLFGPDKLPGLGKTLGKGIRQFREASNSVTKVVQSEVLDPVQKEIKNSSVNPATSQNASNTEGGARTVGSAVGPLSPAPQNPSPAVGSPGAPIETFAQKKARMEREFQEKEAKMKGHEEK